MDVARSVSIHPEKRDYALTGEGETSWQEVSLVEAAPPAQVGYFSEAVQQLREAIQHLPGEEKEVFLLRQNAGLSYEQIAQPIPPTKAGMNRENERTVTFFVLVSILL
jgi:DNA-directed RNA polymerase specialized sigma24 family protein